MDTIKDENKANKLLYQFPTKQLGKYPQESHKEGMQICIKSAIQINRYTTTFTAKWQTGLTQQRLFTNL